MPKELSVTNLLQESRSIPRNKIIAQIFHNIEMMEGWGTGFQRIVEGCVINGNQRPQFLEKAGAFVVVFYKRARGEGVSEGVSGLLYFIKENPGKRSVQIARTLGRPQKTIERWLGHLRKEKKIEYRGSSKKGGYFII